MKIDPRTGRLQDNPGDWLFASKEILSQLRRQVLLLDGAFLETYHLLFGDQTGVEYIEQAGVASESGLESAMAMLVAGQFPDWVSG